ncbi:MAG: helix-hairpin-helix domain-containing protein [Myxococcales bacterium]|nr:helix-hairpin-helix domain-containing protein [Myxococcales bacterium]
MTASSPEREQRERINLNSATEEQLAMLPMVGAVKAARIVTWREKIGRFKRPADLRKVKSFGYKMLKRVEPHRCLSNRGVPSRLVGFGCGLDCR